jgi:hypothetical protein
MSGAYDTHESSVISQLHDRPECPVAYQRRSITLLDVPSKTRITPWIVPAMEFDRIPDRPSSLFCRSRVKNVFIDRLTVIRRTGC